MVFFLGEAFEYLYSSMMLQPKPCMALYDTMVSLKSPIRTHCLGFAFNLAGFILAAGDKVYYYSDTTFCHQKLE